MDKAHALALVNALEAAKVPCAASLDFPAGVGETWTVSIPPNFALDATHLDQLCQYVAGQGLTLSATFSYLGIT